MIRFECYNCGEINEFEPDPNTSNYIVNCAYCGQSNLLQSRGIDDWTVEPGDEDRSEMEIEDDYETVEGNTSIDVDSEPGEASGSSAEIDDNTGRGAGNSGTDVCENRNEGDSGINP